jgi:hypothetical protein
MTVNLEIMKPGTVNLLRDLEKLGLIHVQPSVSRNTGETAEEDKHSFQRFQGIHAGLHGGSVEEFLAGCREDKEHELAIEKRQEEERARRRADAELSS